MVGTCGAAGRWPVSAPVPNDGVNTATNRTCLRDLTSDLMPRRPAKKSGSRTDLAVLSAWAPELAETFVALASDIALVLEDKGLIRKVAQHPERPLMVASDWVGRQWADTVSNDSRAKIEQMLAELAATGIATRREINHPQAAPVQSLALAYSAIRLGERGPILAVGHDLRAQAEMQQRFLAAQQALEQSYWHSRQREPSHSGVAANVPMSASDRASFGLACAQASATGNDVGDVALQSLLSALDGLRERIGQDALPGLLRDAKRLIEQHFLQRALERTGSDAALARSLGISRRALTQRRGRKAAKRSISCKPGGAGSA
jgi:hypothetical protein